MAKVKTLQNKNKDSETAIKSKRVSKRNNKSGSNQNRILKKSYVITRNRAKHAFKMLKIVEAPKGKVKKQCAPTAEKSNWPEKCECTWDSNGYIIRNIRSCLLSNDWNTLGKLLLILFRQNHKSPYFIKEMTKLLLMKNPTFSNGVLLEKLMCNVKLLSKSK